VLVAAQEIFEEAQCIGKTFYEQVLPELSRPDQKI
jgi:hypothetical protein